MRLLTSKAIWNLHIRYIHVPHGITDHDLPHTHLWDKLNWVDQYYDLGYKIAYYYTVIVNNPEWHKEFWDYIKTSEHPPIYHTHGTAYGKHSDTQSVINNYKSTYTRWDRILLAIRTLF